MNIADKFTGIDAKCKNVFSAEALAFAGTSLIFFVLALSVSLVPLHQSAPIGFALLGMGGMAACAAYALARAARRARSLRSALYASQIKTAQSRKALESMSALVCRCDASGVIFEASAAFAALTRTDASAMRGKILSDVFERADANSDLSGLVRAAFSGKATAGLTCEIQLPNRSVRIIEADLNVLRDADGSVESVLFCGWDVTERERDAESLVQQLEEIRTDLDEQKSHVRDAEDRLEELTTIDSVTQLKNHRSFQERLREELRRSRIDRAALSLLRVNIDDFKRYNETYGHSAGDAVLAELASTLSESLRGSDFAARYGGDDFVVLLPRSDYLGALEAAERLRAAVEAAPWQYQAITIGIGASTLSRGKRRRSGLLVDAEASLRYAKQLGANQVIHACDLPAKLPEPSVSKRAGSAPIAA